MERKFHLFWAVLADSGFPPGRGIVRFYAAFEAGDSDGDGLNDAFETLALGTSTNSPDSDGDGVSDATEYAAGSNPAVSNVWWSATTTDVWAEYGHRYLGDQASWPTDPVWQDALAVTSAPPWPGAILHKVTLSGLVDDVIAVDGHPVAWTRGAKVLSGLDVTGCITNLTAGTFRIDLYDWPDLPGGGPNEVRLGRADHPFRVEREWWIPIEILMQPIYNSWSLPLPNPSGIILGSNATFSVWLSPPFVVPSDKVAWTSLHHRVEFIESRYGENVRVRATSIGQDELRVCVEDSIGDFQLPPFNLTVMPLTVVTAKVGVVVASNGQAVVTAPSITQIFNVANGILAQTGMQLEMAQPIVSISDTNGYWDIDCQSNTFAQLLSEIEAFGGMKVYFVQSITTKAGLQGAGVNTPYGMVIAQDNVSRMGHTLAHETCHSCGLCDIYPDHFETPLAARGPISQERMPNDWGNYRLTGEPEIQIEKHMRWLLMFWNGMDNDIPSGQVYGVWYNRDATGQKRWHLSNAPVGLSGMTRTPSHQDLGDH